MVVNLAVFLYFLLFSVSFKNLPEYIQAVSTLCVNTYIGSVTSPHRLCPFVTLPFQALSATITISNKLSIQCYPAPGTNVISGFVIDSHMCNRHCDSITFSGDHLFSESVAHFGTSSSSSNSSIVVPNNLLKS